MLDCGAADATDAVFFVYVVTIDDETFLGNSEHF
jgi:hypothetical protein